MEKETDNFFIPERELNIEFVRASGPGGQNVNKVSTKAQLRWSVGASPIFSPEQKKRIRQALSNRLTKDDEILISSDEERSQLANKEKAVARLYELVQNALLVPKERKATRPSKSSRERRLQEKSKRSEVKKGRRKIEY